jgi:hypothetical protein|tara:strand:+ start:416 stop:982 length:567 start_codon:yes stop_codon:yes gene_type:complete
MISLYKPNPSNTGCAFNFKIGLDQKTQEPALYMSAIQQHSWNSEKKIGSFSGNKDSPEKNINVKLGEFECGEVMAAFKYRTEFSTFHAYGDNKTSIKFVPWDKKKKVYGSDQEQLVRAFGINATRNGNTFKIPIEPGEVEVLNEFFKNFLNRLMDKRFSNQIKLRKDNQKKTDAAPKSSAPELDTAPF